MRRNRAPGLLDLEFITDKYGDVLSAEQVESARTYTRDHEELADECRQPFPHDKLHSWVKTACDRVLEFRFAIEEQPRRRGIQGIEQAAPPDRSLARVLTLHEIWLGSTGQQGQRAQLSGATFRGEVSLGANLLGRDSIVSGSS